MPWLAGLRERLSGRRRPQRAARPTLPVPAEAWPAAGAFLAQRDGADAARFEAQWRTGLQVAEVHAATGLGGLCPLCAEVRVFGTPGKAASFHLREGLACSGCGINARLRQALALLLEGLDRDQVRVYLTEQASTAFIWLQHNVGHAEGSEYGLDPSRRKRLQRRFERLGGQGPLVAADVTALAREAASLDAIGCFDVLEHVPDYRAALREFARVLVPGGRLVLTAPFIETARDTVVRARVGADGGIEHLLPPEVHGDPLGGGVLCYYHFGWDLLDAAREAGFQQAEWVRSFAPESGLFGLWALRARR